MMQSQVADRQSRVATPRSPGRRPTLDSGLRNRDPRLDVYAVSLPARVYTGDFYFTSQQTDRYWIALGDVAGKGIHAAVFMAMIHEELERLSSETDGPAELIASLNRTLAAHMPANRFVTAAVASLDRSGALEIVNAGHPPVLLRSEAGEIHPIPATGPVLGVFSSATWKSRRVQMQPNDSVLFFTDGLLEAESADGTEFGLERAVRSFAATSIPDAATAGRALLREVEPFLRTDDLTLVLLRRR
jgi:sigma-B regulation protein RsbU (phosphoserine phosphatase)